jgi:autotransporter-associated beta strand protein
LRVFAVCLITLVLTSPTTLAVDFYWDGGAGDNVWDTVILNPGVNTNWGASENIPISGDNIVLTAASAPGPITIDVDGSREVNRIVHNGANGDYTFGEAVGADTITVFQGGPFTVLLNQTAGSDLIVNSDILLNQGGSVLRFNSENAFDNSGPIVVNGDVSPSAAAAGLISLSLTTTNKSAGPWVTVNGVISDGPSATMGLIAGIEESQSPTVLADHSGEASVTGLNTFTGSVQVTGGILLFNSIQNAGSTIPNALGTPAVTESDIIMGVDNRISTLRYIGASPAGHSSDRVIHINGSNSQAKIESSGAGPLVLSGTTTSDSSTTNRTLNLGGTNTDDNTYSGIIASANGSGAQQLLKSDAGKWILTAANTYEGLTRVEAGELILQGSSARIGVQGGAVGDFDILNGATFTLDGGSIEALDLNNSGTFNFRSGQLTLVSSDTTTGAGSVRIGTDGAGTLQLVSGSQSFGDVTLQGTDDILAANGSATYQFTNLNNSAGGTVGGISNQNFQINGGLFTHRVDTGTAFFEPRIQGTGGFTKQGAGTLVFNGTLNHSYTGDTRIEGGMLRVTTSDLPTVPTFVAAGATLDLENATTGDEIGRLAGAGTVVNTDFATFAVNFGGADGEFSGSITGLGDFEKRGTGKQILTGASNYTGTTTVVGGGTLEVASGGSITGSSDVRISTDATLLVNGGTIDTPNRVRPIANTGALNIAAGLVKANQIDRTTASTYIAPFIWTGGTVHLLSAATINGSTTTAADRPFAGSLTLDSDMALVIDDTFSVLNTGVLNINGGSVTADEIVTGGNINFTSGTMRLRNDQAFDAARLAALDIDAPLGAGRDLIVDSVATINAPLTLAGGSFSAGEIIKPQNLVLGNGMLNVTNGDLAVAAATAVDSTTGMVIEVSNGGLANAGQFNATGTTATFAATSTNLAGAEINAINSSLTFTGGLTNHGVLNLINSTAGGSVSNQATANLAGVNTFSGDVSGDGVFSGNGTVVFEGSFSPSAGPAEINFGGDAVLAGTNTLFIEIGGPTPADDYDSLTIAGEAMLDGILDVSLIDEFAPTEGQQFTVLSANNIVDNGLVLGGPAASSFNLFIDSTSVILQALAPGLPGDHNDDGTVDAADYVAWRKTNGMSPGYNAWRTHFGEPSGGGGFGRSPLADAAVPELSTWVYASQLIGLLTFIALRRGRSR